MAIRSLGLIAFLKGTSDPKDRMPGCPSYDHAHGGCLFDKPCAVEAGMRCTYFEKAVLPTASGINKGLEITRLYEKATGGTVRVKMAPERTCPDCHKNILLPRQRYCPLCSTHRRQATYRSRRSMHHS